MVKQKTSRRGKPIIHAAVVAPSLNALQTTILHNRESQISSNRFHVCVFQVFLQSSSQNCLRLSSHTVGCFAKSCQLRFPWQAAMCFEHTIFFVAAFIMVTIVVWQWVRGQDTRILQLQKLLHEIRSSSLLHLIFESAANNYEGWMDPTV